MMSWHCESAGITLGRRCTPKPLIPETFGFFRVLDVLEEYLEWRGLQYLRLDGSTTAAERGPLVQQFNDPKSEAFVFLLSIRAGGIVFALKMLGIKIHPL